MAIGLSVMLTAAATLAARHASQATDGVVVGQVVDARTGSPITDVWMVIWDGDNELDETISDDLGRFVLRDVPNQLVTIRTHLSWHGGARGIGGFGQTRPDAEPTFFTVKPGEVRRNVVVPFWRSGVITGRVTDDHGVPVSGAEVRAEWADAFADHAAEVASTISQEDGTYRLPHSPGEVVVRASARGWWLPTGHTNRAPRPETFVPTYAPSVANVEDSALITVHAGEETSSVDVALLSRPAFLVSGIVENDHGPVSDAWVTVESRSRTSHVTSDSAGRFVINGLPAGEYTIRAENSVYPIGTGDQSGLRRLTLSDADVRVRMRLHSAPVIRGRVVFDGAGDRAALAKSTTVSTYRTDELPTRGSVLVWDRSSTTPADDGVFELSVRSIRQLIGVSWTTTWMVRSIDVDGRDTMDLPIDPEAANSCVTITLTDRLTSVSGAVHPRPGTPVIGTSVWILPVDQAKWETRGPYPLQSLSEPVDTDGRFEIEGLPPGTYLALAVPPSLAKRFEDLDYLRRLAPAATRFTVQSDKPRKLDLIVVTPLPVISHIGRIRRESPQHSMPVEVIEDSDRRVGAQLRGRVVSAADGQPVAGAEIKIWPVAGDAPILTSSGDVFDVWNDASVDAVTDANGWFLIAQPGDGGYRLRVRRHGFADTSWNGSNQKQPTIELRPAARLTGTVTDGRGRPASNIPVSVIWHVGETRMTGTVLTDDLGRYVFDNLPPGAIDLVVEDDDHWLIRRTSPDDLKWPLQPARSLPDGLELTAMPPGVDRLELGPGERRVVNLQIRKN